LIIWECAIRGKHRVDFPKVIDRVARWLCSQQHKLEISASKNHTSRRSNASSVGHPQSSKAVDSTSTLPGFL
jgi:hypothetical protein